MDNENWQIPHVKKVLDYHNKLYGTDFMLVGRCEQFFPKLQGGWDWVCSTATGRKGAIEVKRLTDEQKHKEYSILKRIGTELEKQTPCQLRGTYRLLLDIDNSSLHLLEDDKEQPEKVKELKDVLHTVVVQTAPYMAVQQARDISGELKTRLPHILGAIFHAELYKATDSESRLLVEIMTGGDAPSELLVGKDREKFKDLVQQANRQLHEAKTRGLSETFLVLLDLLYHLVPEPAAIRSTFFQLNVKEHCNINYAYLVQSPIIRIKP